MQSYVTRYFLISVLNCLLVCQSASAFNLANSAMTGSEKGPTIALAFSSSEMEYENDDGNNEDFDINRNIMALTISTGIQKKLAIYGTLGFILDSEFEIDSSIPNDGDGIFLSFGIKHKIELNPITSICLCGQFEYIVEEEFSDRWGGNEGDIEIDGYSLDLDVIVQHQLKPNFFIYGGIELSPFNSYDADVKTGYLLTDGDFERDGLFGLRLGLNYHLNKQWFIDSALSVGGEKSFAFSMGMDF